MTRHQILVHVHILRFNKQQHSRAAVVEYGPDGSHLCVYERYRDSIVSKQTTARSSPVVDLLQVALTSISKHAMHAHRVPDHDNLCTLQNNNVLRQPINHKSQQMAVNHTVIHG